MPSTKGFRTTLPFIVAVVIAATAAVAYAAERKREDHKQYAELSLKDCRDCHRSSNVIDNHGAFFLRDHGVLSQKVTKNCGDCHQQSFCLDCHFGGGIERDFQSSLSRRGEYMPKTHRSNFLAIHGIKSADDPQSCERCHDSRRFCEDCHTRTIGSSRGTMALKPHAPTFAAPGVPDPTWVSQHRADARRNLKSCQGCHPQKLDCSNFACHPGLGGR